MNTSPYPYKYEILHLNVRGARSNKMNLECYLAECGYPEIVCLNETKLPADKDYQLNQYNIAARKEVGPHGGSHGSMILTRHDLKDIIEIEELKNLFVTEEIIGIKIKATHKRPALRVFSYYNPPLCSPNAAIIRYISSFSTNCVLAGDLNCKNTVWGSTKTDRLGRDLLECLNNNNLTTFNNGSKTRCDPSSGKEESLDIVIGNIEAATIFSQFWVGPDVGSDHFPVHSILQFGTQQPSQPTKIRRIGNLNKTKFKKKLDLTPRIPEAQTALELECNAILITDRIKETFDECCPETVIKKKAKCAFTPEIEQMVKEKRKLRRQKNAALQNLDYDQARLVMSQINRLGNDIKRVQKLEKQRELERHCHKLNKEINPKKFFQTFDIIANPILKTGPAIPSTKTIEDESGIKAASSDAKATLFAERLQRIHQEPDYKGFDENWKQKVQKYIEDNEKSFKVAPEERYQEPEIGDDSELCNKVSLEEFEANLAKCKNNSAMGSDGISYSLLKSLPVTAKRDICQIFSDAVRIGFFPKIWKSATVKMIPKPHKDPKYAKNFRPISLLSCLGKILERILARRISSFLEIKKLFAKSQSGFRSNHMTSEQLFRLSEESHMAFKDNKHVAALFLDAEAAFDRCWHNGIRYKMRKTLNLPCRISRLISSFITDRSLTVSYEGCLSHSVFLNAGTPQGSPLSPLLYIIYVNDYPEEIQEICSVSQFADDTALWTAAYTKKYAVNRLQKAVNVLEGWCRKWRVKINGEKSKLMILTRTREEVDENLALHLFDDIVRPTKQAKFLGVEIDPQLSFKRHFEGIQAKSTNRLNVLRILSRSGVEAKVLMKLYKCYIRPIIEYGCPSFMAAPHSNMSYLQKVQNEALRICLKLPKYIRCELLHEYGAIETVKERLLNMSTHLIRKMRLNNDHVKELICNHVDPPERRHESPLDLIMADIRKRGERWT